MNYCEFCCNTVPEPAPPVCPICGSDRIVAVDQRGRQAGATVETVPPTDRPLEVMLVTALFAIIGLASLWDMVSALLMSRIHLNTGVVALALAVGVWNGINGWRIMANLYWLIALFGSAIIGCIALSGNLPFVMTVFGMRIAHPGEALMVSIISAVVAVVSLLLLNQPLVRRFCGQA